MSGENDADQLKHLRDYGKSVLSQVGVRAGVGDDPIEDPEPDQVITALANYALLCRDGKGGDSLREQLANWMLQLRAHPSLKEWKDGEPVPEDVQAVSPDAVLQLLMQQLVSFRSESSRLGLEVRRLQEKLDDSRAARVGYRELLTKAVDDLENQRNANRVLSSQMEAALGMLAEACNQPSLARNNRLGVLVGALVQQRDDAKENLLGFTQILEDATAAVAREEHESVAAIENIQPEDVRSIVWRVRQACGDKLSRPVKTTVRLAHHCLKLRDANAVLGAYLKQHQTELLARLQLEASEVDFCDQGPAQIAQLLLERMRVIAWDYDGSTRETCEACGAVLTEDAIAGEKCACGHMVVTRFELVDQEEA